MAKASKKAKAQQAAMSAKNNPYLRRIAEDEDLRKNIVDAFESAKKAYARLNNGKSPSKQIFDDKKLQKEIKNAAESIKDASVALREAPKKKKGGLSFGKVLLVGVAATGVALAVSEGLRKKVLDALFGAEEEFEYSSTTTTTASNESAGAAAGTTT